MEDEAPVFVKRAKSKAVASRRTTTSHNDEEVLSTPISNFKNRNKTKAKPQSRLSFDNDEEGRGEGTFQVKRSKKLTLKGPGASPIPALTSTLNETSISSRSDGPRYDAAYLSELRASTATAPRPERPVNSAGVNDEELAFDASEMEGAVIENLDDMQALMSYSHTEVVIPSESSIKAAKEKRDRLRKTATTEEDFIPLTVSKREGPIGPHPESRLVREDDEMGEGDDDMAEYTGAQERIALSKKGRKEEDKKRKAGIVELIDEAEEQDEEGMEWELSQVRRAGNAADIQLQATAPKTYEPTPIPPAIPVPVLDTTIARLTQKLTALTASHSKNTAELIKIGEENASIEKQEAELKEQVENAEQRRAWFQGFKERVDSVGDFLDEKFPGLEKLEEEHASLLKERFNIIQKRRDDENEDDLVLVFGPPSDMIDVEQVDELGRTIPSNTSPPAPVRRERRAARSQRHARRAQLRGAINSDMEDDGDSTDASLPPSDARDFEEAVQNLRAKVKTLFADVKAKEFRDPKHGIAVWFGEWRTKHEDSWKNAWGGMGLVQAWEFWARVEMVGWIPLDTPPRLEDFAWYSDLHDFSRPTEDEEPSPEEDLPIQMTSTAFVPRLNALLNAGALDPYSTRHITRMLDLAEQLEAYLGMGDIKYQSVLQTVAHGFRKATTTTRDQVTRFIGTDASRATGFQPESLSARLRLMIRPARLLTNLLRWRRYTKERHGLGLLCGEILNDILLPVAKGGWEVGGREALRKIVVTVPSDLVPVAVSLRLNSKP